MQGETTNEERSPKANVVLGVSQRRRGEKKTMLGRGQGGLEGEEGEAEAESKKKMRTAGGEGGRERERERKKQVVNEGFYPESHECDDASAPTQHKVEMVQNQRAGDCNISTEMFAMAPGGRMVRRRCITSWECCTGTDDRWESSGIRTK